jgi:hypothetical protein
VFEGVCDGALVCALVFVLVGEGDEGSDECRVSRLATLSSTLGAGCAAGADANGTKGSFVNATVFPTVVAIASDTEDRSVGRNAYAPMAMSSKATIPITWNA